MVNPRSSFEQTLMGPRPHCYIPRPKVIGPLFLEKIFEGFLPYMGMAVILDMWPSWNEQTFVPRTHGGSTWNSASIGPAVLEKKIFENRGRMQARIQKFWKEGAQNSPVPNYRIWPLFESPVVASLWKLVLHSGGQPCIRPYGDTHRMTQYLLFWLKTKCLKCYTMYNTLQINKLLSSIQVTLALFSTENLGPNMVLLGPRENIK